MSDNNDKVGLGGIFDLSFEKFITPSVVKILYILILVFAALFYLVLLIASLSSGIAAFLGALVFGGLGFLVLILFYRIFLELTMVLFRIHENTEKLASRP
ncbi:MAG: DUF4282 domain-containing protein [Acidimicrobiia bacterium]|nr:MAG: DUF4282 domain-containing protein [Acidimicrobiia bacterium]